MLHTLSLRPSPATLPRNLISTTYIHNLILPVMAISEGLECRLSVSNSAFRLSSLFTATVRDNAHITADAAPNQLSLSPSIFLPPLNKTASYLNFFTWGSNSIIFQQRTLASDLEVLIFILAASHSDRPSAC